MVNRFLGWRLPENFNPDGGISFQKTINEGIPDWPQKNEPVGTNLFDAMQAEAMVRYILDNPDDGYSYGMEIDSEDHDQKLNAQPTAEQPVDGDAAILEIAKAICAADNQNWGATPAGGVTQRMYITFATAALRVAEDRLLAEPTKEEIAMLYRGGTNCTEDLKEILANRRAHLSAKKTVEERVTVIDNETLGKNYTKIWVIAVDGETKAHMAKDWYSREDAEIYRLGLIAKLRESEGARGTTMSHPIPRDELQKVMLFHNERATVARLSAPLSDEDLSVISIAVDTLEIWFDGGYKNASGFSPSWNPTLRRLRNLRDKLIASRAKEPKEPTQDFPHVDSGEKR